MKTKEGKVISSILFDKKLEDEEVTKQYLNEAQIDAEKFRLQMLETIKVIIRNKLFEEGENFRDKFLEAVQKDDSGITIYEDELQYAFRKLKRTDDDQLNDIEKDKKKLDILKKLAAENKNHKKI